MQSLRHIYTKQNSLPVVYLKFQFNWMSYTLSGNVLRGQTYRCYLGSRAPLWSPVMLRLCLKGDRCLTSLSLPCFPHCLTGVSRYHSESLYTIPCLRVCFCGIQIMVTFKKELSIKLKSLQGGQQWVHESGRRPKEG